MPKLSLEKKGKVFVVTLNSPSTGNEINTESLFSIVKKWINVITKNKKKL